ncbi:MAG: hexokinase [Treponemataceae bacterium]
MKTNTIVPAFLLKHNFPVKGPDINAVIDALLFDMQAGLDSEVNATATNINAMSASEPMIPTWGLPPQEEPKNKSVIVIDAGGTNFRSCIVNFDKDGTPTIAHLEKCAMPASEREYTREEFYSKIAQNLDHLKEVASALPEIRIGFCFSYAIKITSDGDGEVISFSKEIKAKEVVGSLVGKSLSEALVKRGWKKPAKIMLLNDTAAALLAGASTAQNGRKYSSYIGLILGTGMNSAYIEPNPIKKITDAKHACPQSQIVVCESGMFNKIGRSDFDLILDRQTNYPDMYTLEKMCSGAYLGPLAKIVLQTAAQEGLFSSPVAEALLSLPALELRDMDQLLYTPHNTTTVLGSIASKGSPSDCETMCLLLDNVIERSARLTSAVICASAIRSGAGKNASLPISILCEGTSFYKTHNLQDRIRWHLNEQLITNRGIYYELITLDNAITLGAAIAGL